jgi:hypothetical protein
MRIKRWVLLLAFLDFVLFFGATILAGVWSGGQVITSMKIDGQYLQYAVYLIMVGLVGNFALAFLLGNLLLGSIFAVIFGIDAHVTGFVQEEVPAETAEEEPAV